MGTNLLTALSLHKVANAAQTPHQVWSNYHRMLCPIIYDQLLSKKITYLLDAMEQIEHIHQLECERIEPYKRN
uniref:Uncharacterized protein n=1 Tax=Romanomermis culicivorax TaxID=13658 RepID=A0A915IXX0_ROMCU